MIALFARVLLRVAMYYCHVMYASEAVFRRGSAEKGVLRNLAKFTGKHLCQGLFFTFAFNAKSFAIAILVFFFFFFSFSPLFLDGLPKAL